MTTRAQLESERHELIECLRFFAMERGPRWRALTASIARVDALLSLDDDECEACVIDLRQSANAYERAADVSAAGVAVSGYATANALRTVANLIRREPRGDV